MVDATLVPPPLRVVNEETQRIPSSMRALYYSLAPKIHMALQAPLSDDESASDQEIIPLPERTVSPGPGIVLDKGFPTPHPSPSQYLLKVQAAAFCQDEMRLVKALNPALTTSQIPLHSICGTILRTPTQDPDRPLGARYKVGESVFGVVSYMRDGGAADFVVATEKEVARKPSNITAAEGAALALPALTAWQALFTFAGLDPDAPTRQVEELAGENEDEGQSPPGRRKSLWESITNKGSDKTKDDDDDDDANKQKKGRALSIGPVVIKIGSGQGDSKPKPKSREKGDEKSQFEQTDEVLEIPEHDDDIGPKNERGSELFNTDIFKEREDKIESLKTSGENKAPRPKLDDRKKSPKVKFSDPKLTPSVKFSDSNPTPNANANAKPTLTSKEEEHKRRFSLFPGGNAKKGLSRRFSLFPTGNNEGGHGRRPSMFPGVAIKRNHKVHQLRILVTNARDSEVGRVAVQLLRAEKLFPEITRPWICVTCTEAEEAAIKEWDIDEILIIPHLPTREECDLGAMFRTRRWNPCDIVLDCTGGEVFEMAHSPDVIKDNGSVLTSVDPRPALEAGKPDTEETLERRKRGIRSHFVPPNPDDKVMRRIAELVEASELRGRQEQVVFLDNAAKLLEAGAAGAAGVRRGGMMVVRVN
ncbi:hypothetical protein N7495_001644 [Penicillium taxi]|uniref:uncharacterized protein n=1 Tax=Penicillium taxi TaxID=168475 RepID=UPI002545B0D5|nr:uncharacterized protein N7495_001644 [Penicillium taxi]KAJ5908962.1 hypothetical protein N7495_001644 [Penicillium taxi]